MSKSPEPINRPSSPRASVESWTVKRIPLMKKRTKATATNNILIFLALRKAINAMIASVKERTTMNANTKFSIIDQITIPGRTLVGLTVSPLMDDHRPADKRGC
jgi:hypothetical protein